MRVVITGGAGFIGANLAHYWIREHPDDHVTVFDVLTYAGRRESLKELEGRPSFDFVRGDVTDADAAGKVVRGADLVLHLAAESHNDRAIAGPLGTVRTNVVGTAVMLEACRKADVPRFHQVSTDEVFGHLPLGTAEKFRESSPYQPRGPYSASKAGADHLVRAWHSTYGLPVTLSSSANNFGPYQFPEKLIPLAIARVLGGGKVPVYGDGLYVRDWIYVLDHCAALDAISHRGRIGETYLVSAELELSNLDLVRRLLALLGRDEGAIEHVPDRPGHDRRYATDASKLRNELGWKPSYDFDTALAATVAWYRENRAWWEPLVAPVAPGTGGAR
jgi:dTDP-glucose 4,6-dehydratase